MRDSVTRRCPQIAILEEKGDPKRNRTEVLLLTSLTKASPLGQAGSRLRVTWHLTDVKWTASVVLWRNRNRQLTSPSMIHRSWHESLCEWCQMTGKRKLVLLDRRTPSRSAEHAMLYAVGPFPGTDLQQADHGELWIRERGRGEGAALRVYAEKTLISASAELSAGCRYSPLSFSYFSFR